MIRGEGRGGQLGVGGGLRGKKAMRNREEGGRGRAGINIIQTVFLESER